MFVQKLRGLVGAKQGIQIGPLSVAANKTLIQAQGYGFRTQSGFYAVVKREISYLLLIFELSRDKIQRDFPRMYSYAT